MKTLAIVKVGLEGELKMSKLAQQNHDAHTCFFLGCFAEQKVLSVLPTSKIHASIKFDISALLHSLLRPGVADWCCPSAHVMTCVLVTGHRHDLRSGLLCATLTSSAVLAWSAGEHSISTDAY